MGKSISITRWVVIGGGVVQLILGMLFWADMEKALIPVHIVVGTIVAASLLTLAILALRARAPVPLGVVGIVWALVLPVFCGLQTTLLHGSLHWIIQVVHLLLGIGAIGLASIIVGRVLPGRPKVGWTEPDPVER
jgi:hypothetical protein